MPIFADMLRDKRVILASLIVMSLLSCPYCPATAKHSDNEKGPKGLSLVINGSLNDNGSAGTNSIPVPADDSAASLSWLLPMSGKLATGHVIQAQTLLLAPEEPKELKGGIQLTEGQTVITKRINELLDRTLDQNEKTKELDAKVVHYRKPVQRVVAEAKDATDYLIPYRGFGPSIEAGNLILDENVKAKSRASAEYLRQKHVDENHVKVVSSMMQLALGLGMSDRARGEAITASGLKSLEGLVGTEEAEKTLAIMSDWGESLEIPEAVYAQGVWDINQRQEKLNYVMENSLEADPVIHQIKKRLHKYNKRSKVARFGSQVVQSTLGAASMAPNFIGPAAKTALLAFVMATGGPERYKLLKELYLDKRFESRWKVLNEEANLALQNYQVAVLTRNPVLLACSESVVGEMVGPEYVYGVFENSVVWPKDDK